MARHNTQTDKNVVMTTPHSKVRFTKGTLSLFHDNYPIPRRRRHRRHRISVRNEVWVDLCTSGYATSSSE